MDRPGARFWHRVAAPSQPHDCGAYALVRGVSHTESAIVLTDSPAGTGRAQLVGGLACAIVSRLATGASPAGALMLADHSVRTLAPPLLVTTFVGVLDHTNETLLYAAAGHEIALIIRRDGVCRRLSTTGPVLGSARDPRFNVRRVAMRAGETLVATTSNDETFVSEIVRSARLALERAADPAVAVVEAVGRFGLGRTPDGYATVVTALAPRAA